MNFRLIEQRARQTLNLLLSASALWYLLAFLYVALFSISYPYGIEWLEGHVMEIAARAHRGGAVYIAPSLDYVPFLYTPLYYYVTSLFMYPMGVDYESGRIVSILATLGTCCMLYRWARAWDASKSTAITAAGLFASAYEITGRWYDLARVDNLSLFLLISAAYMLFNHRGALAALISALLFTLAFYTKQSAIMAAAPLLLWALVFHRRDGITASLTTAFAIGLTVLAANALSEGWFSFYVFDVPAGHGLNDKYLLGFFTSDLLAHWWPLLLAALWPMLVLLRRNRPLFFAMLSLACGLIGSSYASRIHWGGHVNVLIPMAAFFALLTAFSLRIQPWLGLLVLLQFALLYYSPNDLIPGDAQRDSNEQALAEINAIDGDIFMPDLQFVGWGEGKRSHVYGMAAYDIFRSKGERVESVQKAMHAQLQRAFAERRFAAVMPGKFLALTEAVPYYPRVARMQYHFTYPTGLVRYHSAQYRTY